ncbi:20231_t:CDS:2 [Dentiscutata erythropus]|uniref:20231_t:CDS:1 n=1 Tax=Dentiscutata erythropus TaxID=1348616 RepID=A0A9N9BE61_9GLOM|nr:20231_t:CDS:2 [Dentiscutata erythropus]
MSKRKQKQNESVSCDTETDSRNSSNARAGRPPTGVWKFFEKGTSRGDGHWEANHCKKVSEEWRCHFNYILVNNLKDIPTDEPLYSMSNTVSPLVKRKKIAKQPDITNCQIIMQNQVNGGGLKTYIETRWTSVYECIFSIVRLKACLEEIQENHSEIISPVILTILRGRDFFTDMQYLSEVLLPIRNAILAQLCHIHTTEVSPEIMANIAESVFKELEEETVLEEEDIELSNPTHSRTSYEDLDINESDNNDIQEDRESEYNVDDIIARQLDYESDHYNSQ